MAERTSPGEFIRQVRQEAAKVTWPSRRELAISTVMVFIFVFITSTFFFSVGAVLATAVHYIIRLGA